MTTRERLVAALVAIYPAAWRAEYGAELMDLLLARPLDVRTIADVVWSGIFQRLRSIEPATVFGLVAMFAILVSLWGSGWDTLVEPTHITFPTMRIRPLKSDSYVLFLVFAGCVVHLRQGVTPAMAGVAAIRICLLGCLPVFVAGVLMLLGVIEANGSVPVAPLAVILAPLSHVGVSWIWGSAGGVVGRAIARWTARWTPRR